MSHPHATQLPFHAPNKDCRARAHAHEKSVCGPCKLMQHTAVLPAVLPERLVYAATVERNSVRAAPAPTPTVEPSPPTEMSTEGRISEHLARAWCTGSCDKGGRVHSWVSLDHQGHAAGQETTRPWCQPQQPTLHTSYMPHPVNAGPHASTSPAHLQELGDDLGLDGLLGINGGERLNKKRGRGMEEGV